VKEYENPSFILEKILEKRSSRIKALEALVERLRGDGQLLSAVQMQAQIDSLKEELATLKSTQASV